MEKMTETTNTMNFCCREDNLVLNIEKTKIISLKKSSIHEPMVFRINDNLLNNGNQICSLGLERSQISSKHEFIT